MRSFARKTASAPPATDAHSTTPARLRPAETDPRSSSPRVTGARSADPYPHRIHDFTRVPVRLGARAPAQPGLAIGRSGDAAEQQAERVAARVMRTPAPPLQRVSGGDGADGGPEPLRTGPERLRMKRGRASEPARAEAPPLVHDVLRSPGQPLEPAARAFFEPRFGHDFSRVRVHSHASARQSARDMDAQAYTVGHHIVFAAGRYAPATHHGRQLIAHELTHVVQQQAGPAVVQRKLDSDAFEAGSFDPATIRAYLIKIEGPEIEDNLDSDDKARFVVQEWRRGRPMPYGPDDPEPFTKVMLIREMQSGFTGDDDERAILALLVNSSDADLEVMFEPGRGLDPKDLDSDFHGEEESALREFYDRKFQGGRKAALDGSRKLLSQHAPVPETPETPWRELARQGVPFDQWSRKQKQRAHEDRRQALIRSSSNQSTRQWLETRDADNELFRLLHPYHDEQRAFFERSTYTRVESSSNPARSGETVTFTAYVSLPTGKIPTGEVEFTFFDREARRIWGKMYKHRLRMKAPLKDGKASVTIPDMRNLTEVTATYPDTGDLIGSDGSLRQEVER